MHAYRFRFGGWGLQQRVCCFQFFGQGFRITSGVFGAKPLSAQAYGFELGAGAPKSGLLLLHWGKTSPSNVAIAFQFRARFGNQVYRIHFGAQPLALPFYCFDLGAMPSKSGLPHSL